MYTEKVRVNGLKFWAAAFVTALLAGLTAVIAFWAIDGIGGIELYVRDLPEGTEYILLSAGRAFLAAFVGAIVAAAILHLMLLFVVRPSLFFGFLAILVLAVGIILPFTINAPTESQVWLMILHTLVGLVTLGLLLGTLPMVTQVTRTPEPPPLPY